MLWFLATVFFQYSRVKNVWRRLLLKTWKTMRFKASQRTQTDGMNMSHLLLATGVCDEAFKTCLPYWSNVKRGKK